MSDYLLKFNQDGKGDEVEKMKKTLLFLKKKKQKDFYSWCCAALRARRFISWVVRNTVTRRTKRNKSLFASFS
jgi:hypothetical protein